MSVKVGDIFITKNNGFWVKSYSNTPVVIGRKIEDGRVTLCFEVNNKVEYWREGNIVENFIPNVTKLKDNKLNRKLYPDLFKKTIAKDKKR